MIIYEIKAFSWRIANSFCYLFFFYRLKSVFNHTAYAVSQTISCGVLSLVIVYLIFGFGSVLYCLYYMNIYTIYPYNDNSATALSVVYLTISLIIDLVISILLLILFISKLHDLTKKQYIIERSKVKMSSAYDTLYTPSQSTNEQLNQHLVSDLDTVTSHVKKKSMFDVISKIVILSGVMIITTQITIIISIISFYIPLVNHYNSIDPNIFNQIFGILKEIDCLVSVLCLCLNFEFTNKCYLILCHFCHNCAKNLYINTMDKRMESVVINYENN